MHRSLLLLLALAAPVAAQRPTHVDVPTLPARIEDVSTMDGLMKAFYDVVSGPAGAPRQWSRDRSLYIPGIWFVAMSQDSAGKIRADVMSHQDFVDRTNDGFVRRGFFEKEIHRSVQRFGHYAHVMSTYEMRERADGPVFGRGINSLEMYWDGTRWWVASVVWDDERPDNPIPTEYLP